MAKKTIVYPLGKLTLPWNILIDIGLGWSIGSFATYFLGLYFHYGGFDSSLERFFEYSFVSNQDDLAALICYTVSFALFFLFSLIRTIRHRKTLRLPFPDLQALGVSFLKAALWMTPVWVVAVWAHGKFSSYLPGGASWLTLGVFVAIGSFHASLFQNLMPLGEDAEEEEPNP